MKKLIFLFLLLIVGYAYSQPAILRYELTLSTTKQALVFPFYPTDIKIDAFNANLTDTVYYHFGYLRTNEQIIKTPGGMISVESFSLYAKVDTMYIWSNTSGLKTAITIYRKQ